MTDYFPYRDIEGAATPVSLPRALADMPIDYDYEGVPRSLEAYAADYAITGLMVVRGGQVVVERYWRGETAASRHTSWSVAKSFVATLVGIALRDGVVESLDDPVETYAPFYRGTDYGRISIRHLLMMSSGIDFEEDYEVVGSDMRRLFFNTFFLNRDVDRFARGYRQNRPAGTDFHYISPNTIVLGAVVSGAYGDRPLAELASELIFQPLGMESGTWLLDRNSPNGTELSYCCINIRLEDYAKFGLLYLNGGAVAGQQILPPNWPEFVSTPANMQTHVPRVEDGVHIRGYGQHFWIPSDDGAYFAAGYNGQMVWIDPAHDTVVAITGADRLYPGQEELFALARAAARAGL